MGFYDKEENIDKYTQFIPNHDGVELISVLKTQLAKNSTVLELGIGPGKDFELLANDYEVTGSDRSLVFLDKYRKKNPHAELLQLDARTLETDKTFDCIYSNKVLIHLTREELGQSLARQREILNDNGLLMHSFWQGDKEEVYDDLRITYYTERQLLDMMKEFYEVVEIKPHAKMTEGDSIYVLARARAS
jgi:trans-aconitate methyltransferase